jgi:hypothetical protein
VGVAGIGAKKWSVLVRLAGTLIGRLESSGAKQASDRDRCYDFEKNSPKFLAKIFGVFFLQNTTSFSKIWIITLVSKKNANFGEKIGENLRKLLS